jgi:hypothetical protein
MTADFDKKVDEIIDRLVAQIKQMISTKADKTIIESTITESVGTLRKELLNENKATNNRINDLERRIIALEKPTRTRAAQAPAHLPAPTSALKANSVQSGGTVVATPVDLSTVIDSQINELYNQWKEKVLGRISTNEELRNNLNVNIPTYIKESKNQSNFAENLFLILLCIYYKALDTLPSETNIKKIKDNFKLESLYDDSRSLKEEYDKTLDHIGGLLIMGTPQSLKSKLQANVYPENKGNNNA